MIPGPNPDNPGLTYFVGCVGKPIVKIGKAWTRGRIYQIKGPEGELTFPVALIQGEALELRFHAQFEPHHIGHEWFSMSPEIVRAIQDLHAGRFDFSQLPAPGWCVTKAYQTKASISHWGTLPHTPGRVSA